MTENMPVTRQSIAAAIAARDAERHELWLRTGLWIEDAPAQTSRVVIVHCPTCLWSTARGTEGLAIRSLTAHIVKTHHA